MRIITCNFVWYLRFDSALQLKTVVITSGNEMLQRYPHLIFTMCITQAYLYLIYHSSSLTALINLFDMITDLCMMTLIKLWL